MFDRPKDLILEDVSGSKELKKLLKQRVPAAINYAHTENKLYAPLFEINDTNCYIELHKKQWIQALETCMLWYIEDEDYETCLKIKDIIHSIQSKNRPKKLIINKNGKNGE